MSKPKIADTRPAPVELKAGETVWWCSCGRSKTQPFCDGSHAGTAFTPQPFEMAETKTVAVCACKNTGNAPFCDGTHAGLEKD